MFIYLNKGDIMDSVKDVVEIITYISRTFSEGERSPSSEEADKIRELCKKVFLNEARKADSELPKRHCSCILHKKFTKQEEQEAIRKYMEIKYGD
jgi:hypothetical protein